MPDLSALTVDKTMPQTFVAPNSAKGLPPVHNDSAKPIDTGTDPDGRAQVLKHPRVELTGPKKIKRDNLKPEPGDQSKPLPRTIGVVGTFDPEGLEILSSEDIEAGLYNPRRKYKRQKRQRGLDRVKSKRRYRQNRKRTLQRSRIRYKRMKNDPRYKRKKKMRRKYPARYKRRWAAVLTAPEIHFLIGEDLTVGVVHGISPLTGMVTYGTTGGIASLAVTAFLSSVAFFTEADIEAMFALVDAEVGEEAYDDLLPEDIHAAADLEGVHWDGDSRFMARCESLTGCKHLDDMDSHQLAQVADSLTDGSFTSGNKDRLQVVDKGDPHEKDPTDDSYYYGEVDLPDYWKAAKDEGDETDCKTPEGIATGLVDTIITQVHVLKRDYPDDLPTEALKDLKDDEDFKWLLDAASPGIIHLYDQENSPSEGAEVLDHGKLRDHEKHHPAVPAPKPNEALYGQGDRSRAKNLEPVKTAATIDQVMGNTFAPVHERSQKLAVNPFRFSPAKGIWMFNVTGASGTKYRVRVKGVRKGNVKALRKAQLKLSCSCPFWRWQGPEHWAKQNAYLYGRPRGTASDPVIRDPASNHWACKHILAALRFAKNYHFSNEDGGDLGILQRELRYADLQIVFSPDADPVHVAMVHRVIARYLDRKEVNDADL